MTFAENALYEKLIANKTQNPHWSVSNVEWMKVQREE